MWHEVCLCWSRRGWREERLSNANAPSCSRDCSSSVGCALPRRRCCAYVAIGMMCFFIGVGLTVSLTFLSTLSQMNEEPGPEPMGNWRSSVHGPFSRVHPSREMVSWDPAEGSVTGDFTTHLREAPWFHLMPEPTWPWPKSKQHSHQLCRSEKPVFSLFK